MLVLQKVGASKHHIIHGEKRQQVVKNKRGNYSSENVSQTLERRKYWKDKKHDLGHQSETLKYARSSSIRKE